MHIQSANMKNTDHNCVILLPIIFFTFTWLCSGLSSSTRRLQDLCEIHSNTSTYVKTFYANSACNLFFKYRDLNYYDIVDKCDRAVSQVKASCQLPRLNLTAINNFIQDNYIQVLFFSDLI